MGDDVLGMCADVTRNADLEAPAAASVARSGRVNILVNNAGAFVACLAWETPEAQLDWLIDLDVKSVAHAVARQIRTGTVGHNAFKSDFTIAFGGFKQSGLGREGGLGGLLPCLETKTFLFETAPIAAA